MKYRDPETGEFKELNVKVSDTLPVGTEVDYDGDEAPAGWKEVDGKSIVTAYIPEGQVMVFAGDATKLDLPTNLTIGEGFTVSNNRITVNKNMKLKISANLMGQNQITDPTDYSLAMIIYKNGEKLNTAQLFNKNMTTFMTSSVSISPILIDVKAGDYFELYVKTSHNSTILNSGYGVTCITLEEV